MTDKEKRIIETEKDIKDIIPRFKGAHMNYLCERSYESIRNLKLLAENLSADCERIIHLQYETQRNWDESRIYEYESRRYSE